MQRLSEPQVIADELETVTAKIIQIFWRDDFLDDDERAALFELKHIGDHQLRQATITDLAHSIERVGFTPRNIRAIRDLADLGDDCA